MGNQCLNMELATPAGFEPATCPLGGGCSILLSHGAARDFLARSGPSGQRSGLLQSLDKRDTGR